MIFITKEMFVNWIGINRTTLRGWTRNENIKIRAYTFPSYLEWVKENEKIK